MQEKYNIDEEFMNQAWGEMEALLDKEMPVQKRKRRLAFWWLWGGVAASVAIALFYFNFTPLENYSKENIAIKIIEEQAINAVTNDEIAILETAEAQIETFEKEEIEPILPAKTTSSKSTGMALNNTVIATGVSSTKSIPNPPNTPQTGIENTPAKHTISIADIEEIQAEEAKNLIDAVIEITNTSISTKSKKIFDSVDLLTSGNVLPLAYPSPMELLAIKEISRPKKHQWRHGISLGWQQYFESKFDAQIAYLSHFQRQRWQVSSGVGLSFPASLGFANDALQADDAFYDEPDMDTSVDINTSREEEDMDTTSTTRDADFEFLDKNIYTNTNALVIPLFIRYNFNKLSVFAVGQASYHFNNDANLDGSLSQNTTGQELETIKPWNYQLGAGMGYQLGRNWTLDVSYQHRFRSSENAVLVGVHYYFK